MDDAAPFRPAGFRPRALEVEHRPDGAVLLRNTAPLPAPPATMLAPLRRWAREAPGRVWLAERTADRSAWQTLTFGEAEARIDAIAAALIARSMGPGAERNAPVMILSGNSIAHALMTYGAILAHCPAAPVSRAYSTMGGDFSRLKIAVETIRPGLVFVEDGPPFDAALDALDQAGLLGGVEIVYRSRPPARPATPFDDLLAARPGPEVAAAEAAIGPGTHAKYLLTSGSTGTPKAVINTHAMICANAVMTRAMNAELIPAEPQVTLNWLPWNHTFGGNSVLNGALFAGASLYIDDGSPQSAATFARTLENLREITPTTYSNTPSAYAMLAPALDADRALARAFFSKLKSLYFGGAGLSRDVYDRIQTVCVEETGTRILMLSGYGATETAPTIMNVHWETGEGGLLGLPLPGITVKLAPVDGRFEVRVKGVAVTPGYLDAPELTAKAFDEEGFYRLGDAARFLDPAEPEAGLVFDGRIAENFKLSTGTWVAAGKLRLAVVAAAGGLVRDALIAGHDRAEIGVLAWLDEAGVAAAGGGAHARALIAAGLRRHNDANPGSSTRIARFAVLDTPPDADAGEITDKGYVNQRRALDARADAVAALFARPAGPGIVVL